MHSKFTGELLDIIQEGIPNGPEYLTFDDIFEELRMQLVGEIPEPQRENEEENWERPLS